jgi:hypothetical protein
MADLIVVSGDKPKKMQSGGLLDDPRFQRPTGGGGDTPTITDEEKKEMEDALLRTGYGNVVMKRYVNADGEVKYIPFINGEPQMEIPEGYELDESAPKTESNIGGGYSEGGGGDSGGPASPAPAFGDGMTFEKPRGPMVDGVEYKSIKDMDDATLIKYYEQFNSPIYRYAATFATLFFSPLVGGAIAIGQSYSNKNSPTGLNAVQQELMARKLSKEQRTKIKGIYDSIAKNGAGGLSSFTKPITNALGITSDPKKGEKETPFEKYLRTGNITGAVSELNNKLTDPKNKKLVDDNSKNIYAQYKSEGRPQTLGVIESPDPLLDAQSEFETIGEADPSTPLMDEQQNYEVTDSVAPATVEATTATTVERDPRDMSDRPYVTSTDQKAYDSVYESLRRAGSSDEAARDLTKDVLEKAGNLNITDPSGLVEQEKKNIRRLGERQRAERSLDTTDYGRKQLAKMQEKERRKAEVVQDTSDFLGGDYDRDSGSDSDSSSGIDDFFGSDFGQPSQPTYVSQTAKAAGSAKTGLGASASRPQTLGVSAPASSYKTDTGFGYGGSDIATPFYVGGVPTKPMKPQRLKKGGLAKPKVKPKRMKKGGLASRKK